MEIKLMQGDCLKRIQELKDNSVDSIVTDPPYELNFMSNAWDRSGIAFNAEVWKECLRVLKPGGHLLSFGGTRTYHRMAVAIEDAGFEIRDMISWLYGVGFPKSHNIGKAVDKIEGNERFVVDIKENQQDKRGTGHTSVYEDAKPRIDIEVTKGNSKWEGFGTALKPAQEPVVMARKPLSEKTIAENVLKHGTGGLNIDGCRIGTEGGTERSHDPGWPEDENGNKIYEKFKSGHNITKLNKGRFPANIILDEEAGKQLDEQSGITSQGHWSKSKTTGFGKYGGGTNEYKGVGPKDQEKGGASRFFYCPKVSKTERNEGLDDTEHKREETTQGRFPANIILDEEAGKQLDEQSGEVGNGWKRNYGTEDYSGKQYNSSTNQCKHGGKYDNNTYSDSGGASRFFYCAKVSKKERNEGLDTLADTERKNNHPTLKPVALLQYLQRLVTPKSGVTLDPFMGSGSAGKAAIREGFSYIGIELDEDYYKIAEARIKWEKDKHDNETKLNKWFKD